MQKDDRKQINLRVDDELLAAIERIRRRASPIPSVSEVFRQSVLDRDAREAKREERR